jgi:hypothetical protein
VVEPGLFDLDKVSMIQQLRGLGSSIARDALPTMNQIFLKRTKEVFVPSHGPGSHPETVKKESAVV